ncbi:MAG: electron transfer flavoprotein subunit alpha/FixB family protein [Thermoprotei archaeon]
MSFGVVTDPETLKKLAEYKGIWVYAEVDSYKLTNVSLELLAAARSLSSKTNEEVAAVLVGFGVERFASDLSAYGADTVYLVEHEALKSYVSDAYTEAVSQLVKAKKPSIFLFGANRNSRDLASRVAARVETGLAADCIQLELNERGQLEQIRPDFGGKELSVVLTPRHRPQMTTVRPGSFKPLNPERQRKTNVQRFVPELKPEDTSIKVLDSVRTEIDPKEDLEKANVIVAGGMGLRNKDNFKLLQELAALFDHGAVAGTRAVCEKGWLPHHLQVGQSGKTVAPRLYFAIGLSGAIQHLVGMQHSETIVAINIDKDAPIFQVSDYGIVGDLFQVVPMLIEEIKKLKTQRSSSKGSAASEAGSR